jgi:hypothetical protein
MQKLVNTNETALLKIKELEHSNKIYKENERHLDNTINKLQDDKHAFMLQLKSLQETIEKDRSDKKRIEDKNTNLKSLILNITSKIQDIFNKENKIYADNKKIFSDLSDFFQNDIFFESRDDI